MTMQRLAGLKKLDLMMTDWKMIMLMMRKTMRIMKAINYRFILQSLPKTH